MFKVYVMKFSENEYKHFKNTLEGRTAEFFSRVILYVKNTYEKLRNFLHG